MRKQCRSVAAARSASAITGTRPACDTRFGSSNDACVFAACGRRHSRQARRLPRGLHGRSGQLSRVVEQLLAPELPDRGAREVRTRPPASRVPLFSLLRYPRRVRHRLRTPSRLLPPALRHELLRVLIRSREVWGRNLYRSSRTFASTATMASRRAVSSSSGEAILKPANSPSYSPFIERFCPLELRSWAQVGSLPRSRSPACQPAWLQSRMICTKHPPCRERSTRSIVGRARSAVPPEAGHSL